MKILEESNGSGPVGPRDGRLHEGIHYDIDANGCWLWKLRRDRGGYGRTKVSCGGNNGLAHRVSYQQSVGTIPAGLDLDHLCRVRACINPEHLEPVTRQVNVLRGNTTRVSLEDRVEIKRAMLELAKRYGVTPRTLAAIAESRAGRY